MAHFWVVQHTEDTRRYLVEAKDEEAAIDVVESGEFDRKQNVWLSGDSVVKGAYIATPESIAALQKELEGS